MTEPPSPFLLHPFDLLVWCVGPLGTAMRVRVLHAKLYAYALPGLTARQLFNSSTLLDSSTELDRTRQTSTDLDRPRRPGTCSQARRARQLLDSYLTAPLPRLDRARGLDSSQSRHVDSTSTERPAGLDSSLDSSTAKAQYNTSFGVAAGCCGVRVCH